MSHLPPMVGNGGSGEKWEPDGGTCLLYQQLSKLPPNNVEIFSVVAKTKCSKNGQLGE